MKICSKCLKNKPENMFSVREDSGKYRNYCKECMVDKSQLYYQKNKEKIKTNLKTTYNKNKQFYKKRAKQWQKKNPDKKLKYSSTWRWKLRMEIIRAYGGKCVCCGEKTTEFLSIDHINNDGKKNRKIEVVGGSFYRWLKINKFPKDRFQLLCYNCNFAKGHFGYCPHIKNK